MRREAQSPEADDFRELEARAWGSLLAASTASRHGVRADFEWLALRGDCYGPAADAPATVRPLLDLYGPLCLAQAEPRLTIAHLGQSLDGYIATASGDSYYVTGPDNVRHLHRLRALSDAVIVGAGTIARDDPQLTVRHVTGPNPVRIVLDPSARLDVQRRVFTDAAAPTLVVHAAGVDAKAPGRAEVLRAPASGAGLDLGVLLEKLHERGLTRVFVEGGGSTVSRFVEAGLVDRLHVAIAAIVTGRGRAGLTLPARERIAECVRPAHRVFTMGGDVLFDCDLRATARAVSEPSGSLTRAV